MTDEVTYDAAAGAPVTEGHPREAEMPAVTGEPVDGLGCHSGSEMEKAARMAGNSEMLDKFAADYPQGPHDKP